MFGNIGVWAIEQFIKADFEFLSASYLLSEFALLFMYWIAEDYLGDSKISSNSFAYENYVKFVIESNILSNREIEVLNAILENKKRKDIAVELNVSENTIKTHTRHIFEKLEVGNREELIQKADNYNE